MPDALSRRWSDRSESCSIWGSFVRRAAPWPVRLCASRKKDGGVWNSMRLPLSEFVYCRRRRVLTIDDIRCKIGCAQFISRPTFDAQSFYWQTPIQEEDRWLTAFVTHDRLGRLKTRDWKTRDNHIQGVCGKRETSSYGTPKLQV